MNMVRARIRHERHGGGGRAVSWRLATVRRLHARWRTLLAARDRGSATADLVIAIPALLLIILFIFQGGVWMRANQVAEAAANRAATVAAAYRSSAAAGQAAGQNTLAMLGGGILKNPTVSVTRTATDVRVEIDATAETIVPGITWQVRAVVVRPVERFIPVTPARAPADGPIRGGPDATLTATVSANLPPHHATREGT